MCIAYCVVCVLYCIGNDWYKNNMYELCRLKQCVFRMVIVYRRPRIPNRGRADVMVK